MDLILWRHAEAGKPTPTSSAGSPREKSRRNAVAPWLKTHPGHIVVQPRAKRASKGPQLDLPSPTCAPGNSVGMTCWRPSSGKRLAAAKRHTVVVGHQPTLGRNGLHALVLMKPTGRERFGVVVQQDAAGRKHRRSRRVPPELA